MTALQQLYQVGRSPRLEPVAAELIIFKSIEQAERIVDAFGIFGKMVAIVTFLQFGTCFFVSHLTGSSQFVKFFFKIVVYLLFGHPTNADVGFVHGDIVEIVQVAEYAYFTKLRNSGKEGELDAPVHRLQCSVERFQGIAEFRLQSFVADGLQHGLVIFVNEYDNALSRSLVSTLYDSRKTQ